MLFLYLWDKDKEKFKIKSAKKIILNIYVENLLKITTKNRIFQREDIVTYKKIVDTTLNFSISF